MDLNKVTLMGNIGQEPTFHTMKSGGDLCKFSLATTRKWKDRASGERREETSWHNIVVFNPYLVEHVCMVWLQKGSHVYIEGEIKTRKYDKDGETKYITEIIVPSIKGELFVLARGKGWDTNETPGSERRGGGTTGGGFKRPTENFDDDIPF